MAPRDDTTLVGLAQAGDSAAFGELFERYHKKIYNYAYGIAGNPEDAKDIAQDAFVRVFQALPKKDGPLNFSAYVYRTTHNLACDALKARKRFTGPEALDFEHEPSLRADPERVTLVREQQAQARQAAFSLSENHRAVLTLRELHEMSYQEIADVLDMPRNTVGVYLSRARLEYKEAFRMTAVDVEKLAEECQEMLPLLSAYLDQELAPDERSRVESHLDDCAFCRLALEEMTEASRSYRGLLPLLPPADIAEAVMGRVPQMSKVRVDPEGASPVVEAPPAPQPTPVASTPARPPLIAKSGWVVIVVSMLLAGAMVAGGFLAPVPEGPPAPEPEPRSASLTITPTAEPTVAAEPDLPTEGNGTPLAPPEPEPEPDPVPPPDTTPPATPGLVSPEDAAYSYDATFTLTWTAVEDPSGVSYIVEVESWVIDAYQPRRRIDGITGTSLIHVADSTGQRWRVTSVDGAGNASQPSEWREFTVAYILTPPLDIYEPPELY